MELRQLRYFVRIVELGSLTRAAQSFGVVTSALSQQITRLESELDTRLLQRTATGVTPTDAGVAFLRQAQLALRHADDAILAAQQARLSGHVSVGLASTTAAVLGLPLLQAMQARYPDVRLRLVESLSGNLARMLNARELDLAVLFHADATRRWSVTPLLTEPLLLIGQPAVPGLPQAGAAPLHVTDLAQLPLIMPTSRHGLRALLDDAFARADCRPRIVMEIDGLGLLLDAVRAGHGVTVQPAAALARLPDDALTVHRLADDQAVRRNLVVSLAADELSPAALAARAVLCDVARELVQSGRWIGASLHDN